MFIELIQKDNGQSNNFFRTLMQMDEKAIQEIMVRMKQAVVKGETFGLHKTASRRAPHGPAATGRARESTRTVKTILLGKNV